MRLITLLLLCLPLWAAASELPVNTRLGGDFGLASTVADTSRLSDFRGKVVLLNFGFTSCPDVCPMVLSRMSKALNELEDERAKVQPVFVSFDPERDTVERLKAYLQFFGKDFVGMTGTPEQIAKVARQYGVVYLPQKSESAMGTMFAHSDYIYLLDQQGRVRALFANSDAIDKIVDDIESLLDD